MRMLRLLLFASAILISAAIPLAAGPTCQDECWAQWNYCCGACGVNGTFWCYDACDQSRDQCLNSCP